MRNHLVAGLVTWVCVSSQPLLAAEPETRWNIGEMISGRSVRAIQAALPELERRNLRVDDYFVSISQLGEFVLVIFGNREDVLSERRHTGCAGPRVCVGVTLAAENFRVISSSFQK